jgi:hypothetical protein
MPCGSSITWHDAVQDWCAGPHHVKEAQRVRCQQIVEAARHLEWVTALIASLKPEAGSPRGEAGEVQDMDAQAGREFRPNRPGLGKSGVDGDACPSA